MLPDALLLDLLEVLGHDLLHLVQEAEQQRHVAVGATGGHNVDVAVLKRGNHENPINVRHPKQFIDR